MGNGTENEEEQSGAATLDQNLKISERVCKLKNPRKKTRENQRHAGSAVLCAPSVLSASGPRNSGQLRDLLSEEEQSAESTSICKHDSTFCPRAS